MELSRRFGVAIVSGIPAIVVSGLLWALFENWIVVFAYLILLSFTLLVFLVSPQRISDYSQIWEPASSKIKSLGSKIKGQFSKSPES